MSLIESIIKNTPDRHTVEANERYQLRLVKATFGSTRGKEETDEQEGKPKRPVIHMTFEIVDDPLAYPIFEDLYFPIKGDSDSTIQSLNEKVKKTFVALGYNPEVHGDINPDDFRPGMEAIELPGFKGMTGWAVLGIREFNDQDQNYVKKWVEPTE